MAQIENEPKCGVKLNSFERKEKVLLTLMLRLLTKQRVCNIGPVKKMHSIVLH